MTTLKQILERQEKIFCKKFDIFATEWTVPPTITEGILSQIKSHILQDKLELLEAVVGIVEKADSFWRHPMALYPKDYTRQEELKEMKIKDDILSQIKELRKLLPPNKE